MLGLRRGDTIIEVMVAITVFSLMAVGALAITNQASTLATRNLELTAVRSEVNGQAEALRMMHDSYTAVHSVTTSYTGPAAQWQAILTKIASDKAKGDNITTPHQLADIQSIGCSASSVPSGAIVIDTRNVKMYDKTRYSAPDSYAQLSYGTGSQSYNFNGSKGIWVEPVRKVNTPPTPNYIDFYIFACWSALGQSQPVTLGTIVRLYEPLD